jgi:hypothetical protein
LFLSSLIRHSHLVTVPEIKIVSSLLVKIAFQIITSTPSDTRFLFLLCRLNIKKLILIIEVTCSPSSHHGSRISIVCCDSAQASIALSPSRDYIKPCVVPSIDRLENCWLRNSGNSSIAQFKSQVSCLPFLDHAPFSFSDKCGSGLPFSPLWAALGWSNTTVVMKRCRFWFLDSRWANSWWFTLEALPSTRRHSKKNSMPPHLLNVRYILLKSGLRRCLT